MLLVENIDQYRDEVDLMSYKPISVDAPTTIKQAEENIGGLSNAQKMPALSWNIPVEYCDTGSKLITVDGSACFGCYADASRYKWSNVKDALEHHFNKYLENRRLWVESVIYLLNNKKIMQDVPFFRWFDAGDIIDLDHLYDIYRVAIRTPQIKHWLPTKEWKFKEHFILAPDNLVVRVSAPFKNRPFKSGVHGNHSVVLTQKEFDDTMGTASQTGINYCPAYLQQGQCKDCRTCWDSEAEIVAYRYHGKKSDGMSTNLLQIDNLHYVNQT